MKAPEIRCWMRGRGRVAFAPALCVADMPCKERSLGFVACPWKAHYLHATG